jgi:uncharacterized OB-fold protein
MASICSLHRDNNPDCPMCQASPTDLFPDYHEKLAEAEAAGRYTCRCGFVYYRTVDYCPLCSRPMEVDEKA